VLQYVLTAVIGVAICTDSSYWCCNMYRQQLLVLQYVPTAVIGVAICTDSSYWSSNMYRQSAIIDIAICTDSQQLLIFQYVLTFSIY
jgi:hypothetical protein